LTRGAAMLVAGLALTACLPAPVPEAFPQDVADAWLERYELHDAAGLAALYTEDAQLLPPDAEIVSGRAAIQEFYARENPPGSAEVEIATVETLVFGDHAYRQGSFRLKGPGDGDGVAGKFIELWKKVEGKWLIHREIWSANAPPPGAEDDEPA
jgi:ketosteroid isomerase-like protein